MTRRFRAWVVNGDSMDGSYEAIAPASKRLDEAWAAGGVAESFADPVHGRVQTVFVIDKGAVRPNCLGDLLTGEDLAGALEEHEKDLKGLRIQLDPDSLLAEFSCRRVRLENSELVAHWGRRV
jgi:hypothetical protein